MSHNITKNSLTGEYEVMTRGGAWHNLGTVVEDAQTWEETIQKAGLDWTISKRQLEYNGIEVPAYGIFRDDIFDIEKSFLAPATATYELIQNKFMFAFLDTMIEADGKAHYESAGSLNGGSQVFACINLGVAFEIGSHGDRFENYLCFLEDRTGKKSAKCFITTIRVVCANTFEAAYQSADSCQAVKFRHSKNIHQKMVDAAGLFTGARMDVSALQSKLTRLAERQVNRDTLVGILNSLFPGDEKENSVREQKMIDVVKLFENNDHNMFPEIRGTAYNLFNAFTEYVDHFAPVRRTASKLHLTDDQIRSEKAFIGEGAEFKAKVLDTILQQTQYAPKIVRASTRPREMALLN